MLCFILPARTALAVDGTGAVAALTIARETTNQLEKEESALSLWLHGYCWELVRVRSMLRTSPYLVDWLLCLHLFVNILLLRVWTSSEVFWAKHTLSMFAGWKTAANAAATGVLPGLLPLPFGKCL